MLWLALHLPALSLEAWAATLPAPTGAAPARPLALLHEHQVLQVDACAQAGGVRPGMTRSTALALVPDLQWAQADARREVAALRAVADVALGFSPSVAWATPASWRPAAAELAEAGNAAPAQPAPSPALVGVRLEVQSCLRLFGGLPALLQRLQAALAPLGHQLRIASAPTALGAALLAAWRDDLALGPHSTRPAALHRLLDDVPLPLLGAGLAHAAALQGMGLQRLGDLAALPRDGLARRFSPALLADIDRARGHRPEAHRWLSLPPQFSSRLELQARADTSAQVLAGAQHLLARLVAWAQARQGRIVRCTLHLHHEPRHRHDSTVPTHSPLEIAPAQPCADAAHLHSLLAERLGRLPLAAPVLELSLHCQALAALPPPNHELFVSRSSQREGLARLVERLQARLGRAQVQGLAPAADHRPEHGTRWQPADAADWAHGGRPGSGAPDAATAAQARQLGPQPLWLLPEPQPLALRAQRPLHQGQPLQLLAGPVRLETGWWDGAPALRDYFIAQAAGGALVWVFCHRQPAPEAGPGAPVQWFLQGLFA